MVTPEFEAKMLRDLNDDLLSFMERIGDLSQWLISYVDTRTPMRADGEVYLIIGHRSINNGNKLARIDCCEVERVEYQRDSAKAECRRFTENGFRVSAATLDVFEMVAARDVLAALYGFVVCYHADVIESAKRDPR